MADATQSSLQRKGTFAALAALALAAGGCSQTEQPDNPDNASTLIEPLDEPATPIPEPDAPLPELEPALTNQTENSSIAIPPEEPTLPDMQVKEDAEATGMTARRQRDEPPEAAPAAVPEQ